jgi:hypothetical protein
MCALISLVVARISIRILCRVSKDEQARELLKTSKIINSTSKS